MPTPPDSKSERVSWKERIGLGLGRVVADGSHGTLHVLVNPIYNMTLGLNPALISTVVFIQRIWDAMLDPIWGNFSDNFRSRWGRRRPLLIAAALPLALFFAAIWWVPAQASQSHLFWHLLVTSLLFYAAHSLFSMPLGGLTLEATDDYHERTRLASVTLTFGFAFQIASQWLFPLTQLSFFNSTLEGLHWVAVGTGVLFLLFGLLPSLLCRERHYHRVSARQPSASLWSNLKAVRGNRAFLAMLSARFVASFGYNLVGMLGIYMNAYYVYGGDLKSASWAYGYLGSAFHVAAIISSLFIYPRIAQRFGKKRTFQIAASILIVDCLGKLFLYQPAHPWLQVFVLAANGTASAGLSLVPAAMLGDIADEDEIRTGLRREALFASILSWFEKAGNSLGSLLAGYVLIAIGFEAARGAQTVQTLTMMKLAYVIAPTIGAALSLYLIRGYYLSEERVEVIKTTLQQRRQAAAAATPPA